jgi:hypothetical protein
MKHGAFEEEEFVVATASGVIDVHVPQRWRWLHSDMLVRDVRIRRARLFENNVVLTEVDDTIAAVRAEATDDRPPPDLFRVTWFRQPIALTGVSMRLTLDVDAGGDGSIILRGGIEPYTSETVVAKHIQFDIPVPSPRLLRLKLPALARVRLVCCSTRLADGRTARPASFEVARTPAYANGAADAVDATLRRSHQSGTWAHYVPCMNAEIPLFTGDEDLDGRITLTAPTPGDRIECVHIVVVMYR